MSNVLITEKDIGRKFITKDGRVFIVANICNAKNPIFGEYSIVEILADGIENYRVDSPNEWSFSINGKTCEDQETEMDFVRWVDEKKDEKMEQEQHNFKLSITVRDINNNFKNEISYFENRLDAVQEIYDELDIDAGYLSELLENKGDKIKFTKVIKVLEKEVGAIIVSVEQLGD